jgi:hypothetical protein
MTIATLLTSTGILLDERLRGGGINSFAVNRPKGRLMVNECNRLLSTVNVALAQYGNGFGNWHFRWKSRVIFGG